MSADAFDRPVAQGEALAGTPATGSGNGIESGLDGGQTGVGASTPASKQPVNLDDFEDFRKYKSSVDKRQAQLKAEFEQREAQYRQQLDTMQKQLAELMPPEKRAAWEQQQLAAERDQYKQGYEQVYEHIQRIQQLEDLSKRYGIDAVDLMEAQAPIDAFELIAQRQQERIAQQEAELAKFRKSVQARIDAGEEVVDLGSPSGVSRQGDLQRRYNEAAKQRDGAAMDRIALEAMKSNVTLNRFEWLTTRS